MNRKDQIEKLLKAKWRLYEILEKVQSLEKYDVAEMIKGQIDSINEQIDELDIMSVEQ